MPLGARVQKSFQAWLRPGFGDFRLDYNADRLEALATERASEWDRIGKASFLTLDEQREAVGYGPAPKDGVFAKWGGGFERRYSPNQPRAPAGSAEGGQWTSGGGGGGVAGSVSLLSDAEQVALNIDPNVASDVGLGGIFQSVAEVLVNLLDEEGGNHKGHTIRDHVGKSDAQLKNATRDTVKKLLGVWVWKDEIGSFSSLTAADKLVNATLSLNQQLVRDIIDGLIGGGVAEAWFSTPTGYQSYLPKYDAAIEIRTTYGVRVVIVGDKNAPRGFRIKTAYPIYKPRNH